MAVTGVGVIGAGAVGSSVAAYLREGRVAGAELAGVLVRSGSLEELLALGPGVVVEAASHEAVRTYAVPVVRAGVDLVVVSTGALLDADLRDRLGAAAEESGARVRLISGAIGAVDALRAARVDGLESVEVEQRKPASSLVDEELDAPRTVFEGSVADAVAAFPKTTNILATVALAGLGSERTRVRIVADPAATSNRARLVARGAFGSFEFEIDNRPSSNPRTSAITALSVVSALQSLLDSVAVA